MGQVPFIGKQLEHEVKGIACNLAFPVAVSLPAGAGKVRTEIYGGISPVALLAGNIAGHLTRLNEINSKGDPLSEESVELVATSSIRIAQAIIRKTHAIAEASNKPDAEQDKEPEPHEPHPPAGNNGEPHEDL